MTTLWKVLGLTATMTVSGVVSMAIGGVAVVWIASAYEALGMDSSHTLPAAALTVITMTAAAAALFCVGTHEGEEF